MEQKETLPIGEGVSGKGNEDFSIFEEIPSCSACGSCAKLEKRLRQEQEKCSALRANIHKVSANWFIRKSQFSESEMETDTVQNSDANINSTSTNDDDKKTDQSAIPENVDRKVSKSEGANEMSKLINIIAQKSAQLDLSEHHCRTLKKKMREYESIIDEKDSVVHGLKDQLESYLNDNQKLSSQLKNLASLFVQLERAEKESATPPPTNSEPPDSEESIAPPLPTQDEYKKMASSVSRTYIKLKDLIYEKRALVTEIDRLNTLNVELQRRVLAQENRLMSVTDALHQTWMVVSDLKEQHAKLHEDELLFKYELQEKREILTQLRRELDLSREKWQIIREKNLESEQEYAKLREMLRERRNALKEGKPITEEVKVEPDEAVCLHPDDTSFDPPVDLLLEMGLEYGIIGEGAEMTETVHDVIRGEDIRANRLEQLEEHCSLLYTKLISSTSRSLTLASRLTRLHDHFGDEEYDDEEEEYGDMMLEGEEVEEHEQEDLEFLTEENQLAVIESALSSPVSEEYDTAYVSETDAENQTDNVTITNNQTLPTLHEANNSTDPNEITVPDENGEMENGEHLSKTLINFLPKKIEILREQNSALENRISVLKNEREIAEATSKKVQKEKLKLEEELKILTKEMALEKIQKRQLEQQLKHLGKCVDELKLNHDSEKKKSASTISTEDSTSTESDKEDKNEERTEEEKHKEADKIKREVDLLKKEMELKKKEKDLKKREQEFNKKEKTAATAFGDLKTGQEKLNTSPSLGKPAVENSSLDEMINSIVHHLVSKENDELTENSSSHERLTAQKEIIESFDSQAKYTMVKGSDSHENTVEIHKNGALVLPFNMREGNEKIECYFCPSKDAVLVVVQISFQNEANKEHSYCSVPTSKSSPSTEQSFSEAQSSNVSSTNDHSALQSSNLPRHSGNEEPKLLENYPNQSDTPNSQDSIEINHSPNSFQPTPSTSSAPPLRAHTGGHKTLIPSTVLRSNVESSVSLTAKTPVVCVIVLRQTSGEEFQVTYKCVSTKRL